jgi:hypothetical protein
MSDYITLEVGSSGDELSLETTGSLFLLESGESEPPDPPEPTEYDVFTIPLHFSFVQELKFANVIGQLGDGFEQRVNKNLSWGPRGDGLGGASGSSYKGINTFKLNLKNLRHVDESTTEYANVLWDFYIDHSGTLIPFYFYNPVENDVDPTGVDVKGRYLVRFADDALSRDNFVWHLFNVGITLIEVRG